MIRIHAYVVVIVVWTFTVMPVFSTPVPRSTRPSALGDPDEKTGTDAQLGERGGGLPPGDDGSLAFPGRRQICVKGRESNIIGGIPRPGFSPH